MLRRSGPPYRLATRELARRTLVTVGAISQRLTRAEHARLVSRSAAADGSRSVIVALTAAGHAVVERTVDRVLSREADLVENLSPAQRTDLAALLDRLLRDVADRVGTGTTGPRRAG